MQFNGLYLLQVFYPYNLIRLIKYILYFDVPLKINKLKIQHQFVMFYRNFDKYYRPAKLRID